MSKKLTKDQQYYRHKKATDPTFLKKKAEAQKERYATNPEYRKYHKQYHKKYYQDHREELNEKHRKYEDKTRNERVRRYWQRESEKLSKKYIMRLFLRHGKYTAEEITPYMIAKKRREIRRLRASRA